MTDMTATATALTEFTALDGTTFLAANICGEEKVVCVLGHPDEPWCRIVRRNGNLEAQEQIGRGSDNYARAGKGFGEIFRRYSNRLRVRKEDLILAYTGDEFVAARYQFECANGQHAVVMMDGMCFETAIFEPYRFARHERVWAQVDVHRWELALFIEQTKLGFRVQLLDERLPAVVRGKKDGTRLVPLIHHRDDPHLSRHYDRV